MNNKAIKVYIVGDDRSYANLFLDKIEIVTDIPSADIVLFTGGEDVYPGHYGEDIGKYTNFNRTRDKFEIQAFDEARKYNKFIVSICRGAQICTVLSGGGLVQHVTGHAIGGTHKIHLMNEDVDIDITSTHHQMMWPFWLNKDQYQILAKSTTDLSTTYLNGDDCEKSLPDNFVESEIVYYKDTNCLCIQGHPEYMPKDSSAIRYINVLIREYLEDTVEIVPKVRKARAEDIANDIGGLNAIDWNMIRVNGGIMNQIRAQEIPNVWEQIDMGMIDEVEFN